MIKFSVFTSCNTILVLIRFTSKTSEVTFEVELITSTTARNNLFLNEPNKSMCNLVTQSQVNLATSAALILILAVMTKLLYDLSNYVRYFLLQHLTRATKSTNEVEISYYTYPYGYVWNIVHVINATL